NFESGASHQFGRHSAHVAEALHDDARVGWFKTEAPQSLHGDDHAATSGGFGAAARSAQVERLAGDNRGAGLAFVHGVGVHDPRHGLRIRIYVRGGNIALGADDVHDLGGVAARDALELTGGKHIRI